MDDEFNGPLDDRNTCVSPSHHAQSNDSRVDPVPSSSSDVATNTHLDLPSEQGSQKTTETQDVIGCDSRETGAIVGHDGRPLQDTQTETLVHITPADDSNTNQSTGNQERNDELRYVVVGGSLIPPTNFGMIEDDMYRSGLAIELNFAFLEQLRLKTMLYLASEELPDALLDFIEDQGIELVQLAPEQDELPAPWKPISEDVVLSAMEYLLDPSTYPIYVMCSQGRHRTGTVIGCLRKLQRWILSSIFEEYHRYADGRGRLANEQFIELFDTDLVNLPTTNRPRWLQ